MRDTQLILIDGMPGTGKSTAAQSICESVKRNGISCRWHHEERSSHPLRLFYNPECHSTSQDYVEAAQELWSAYVEALCAQEGIEILDAALLQNHVRSMLLFDCERDSIFALARAIEGLLDPVKPVFIYMRPTDIEGLLQMLSEVRGPGLLTLWMESQEQFPYARGRQLRGFNGLLAFWREFRGISDEIFESLAVQKLRLDIAGTDWGGRYGPVFSLLGLSCPGESSAREPLERFVGTYERGGDDGNACVLRSRDGGLVVRCDQPTLDVESGPIGCFREVHLVPGAAGRFQVAGWPHQVVFHKDASGKIAGMDVTVSEDGWAPDAQTYRRVR